MQLKLASYNQVKQQTDNLIESIIMFSDSLPKSEIYHISERLRNAASSIPQKIEESYQVTNQLEKLRYRIQVDGAIEECRDYLKLAHLLRYGNAMELIEQLDNVNEMLK